MSDQQDKDALELFGEEPEQTGEMPPLPDFEEEIREVPPAERAGTEPLHHRPDRR